MNQTRTVSGGSRRVVSALAAMAASVPFVVVGLAISPSQAKADVLSGPAPIEQRSAAAVTADPLPTVQIDSGVVWAQTMIGNTVYAGGNFSNARPAGAAPGTQLTPRSNLLAYDIRTGNLVTSFAPQINGQVKALASSPDGKRLYVGGTFNQVDGQTRWNFAAFDTATGALLTTFKPAVGGSYVNAIVATDNAVYVGGLIGAGAGVTRKNLAAFDTNGKLLGWAPTTDLQVDTMVLTPAKDKLIIGGRFGQVNGVSQRGLAALDLNDGSLLPWSAPQTVINGLSTGPNAGKAGIYSLSADSQNIYGTGWVYADVDTGNLEGTFSADAESGDIRWVADCHGDTYSSYSNGTYVYTTSHHHDCSTLGGQPQADPAPGNMRHADALTVAVKGTLSRSPETGSIYKDWSGTPAPAMVDWFPDFTTGTATGQGQAGWTTVGNGDYISIGGEFPYVNNQQQQGLVRFGRPSVTTPQDGPRLSGNKWQPAARSLNAGTARISIPINWDRDDLNLTYQLFRNGVSTPIATRQAQSTFWSSSTLVFNDSGLNPGSTYTYRVVATDPDGNTASSANASVTVSNTAISAYAGDVINDGASLYWRLGSNGGADWAGSNDGAVGSGVTNQSSGAIKNDSDTGSAFDGTDNGRIYGTSAGSASDSFTIEAWIKTTTTSGGKIVGFGDGTSANSSSYDRHVYMSNDGTITFGVYPNAAKTISSAAAYNDGQWHYIVASQGSAGMSLAVDGKVVASDGSVTTAQDYQGRWHVGGDNLNGWPNGPASNDFAGSIDDVAIYPTVLSRATMRSHYEDAGYTLDVPAAPSDTYGAAVYAGDPLLYWRLNDAVGSQTAADSGQNDSPGNVQGGVTLGVNGILSGNTAAQFDGSTGQIVSTRQVSNPTHYTELAWFKTTTTSGGKIIGFGDAQSGSSSNYDRHVYMQDDGTLVFGVWTGNTNTITTQSSYNDGAWHQVVASQGDDGMKLYVDGALVGTNPQTSAQAYSGYWRIGSDTTWGSSSAAFQGVIDEAAVYSTVLSANDVSSLYADGSGVTPPSADFSASAQDLAVSFDASASTGGNGGTITDYEWTFGDGDTGTGVKPDHTYSAAGTYTVTLKITDDGGREATASHQVTVTPGHAAPTADIAKTIDGLAVSFDGSGSTAADGATITGYQWSFGDGDNSTDSAPVHKYAKAGTYPVSLVVTDSKGASSAAATASVTVEHADPVAKASISADGLTVSADGSNSTASDDATLTYAWTWGDGKSSTGKTATHTYDTAGSYDITLTVTDSLGASDSLTKTTTVTHADPVAKSDLTANGLAVSADGSGSSASDGATLTYAWSWGDSNSSTGKTASHTYEAAGSYDIKLTVTDSLGGSDSVTKSVTVQSADDSTLARDDFSDSQDSGWGTADVGGDWTSAPGLSVSGGKGIMALAAAKAKPATYLSGVDAKDSDATITAFLDKAPVGGAMHLDFLARQSSAGYYHLKVQFTATGSLVVSAARTVGTTETLLKNKTITGYTAGTPITLRLQLITSGDSTTINGKVWRTSDNEPSAWTVTASDNTASLQGTGRIGVRGYLAGSVTNPPVTLTVDDLVAKQP